MKPSGKTVDFVLWLSFILMHRLPTCTSYRPCLTFPDSTYGGGLVDCSNSGISSRDIAKINIPNVSTLIISNNNINALLNNSFAQFTKLKRLECDSCSLSVLGENALKGLGNLDLLSLQNNNLKIINRAFPRGFFHPVPRLRILKIGWNGNDGPASNYSDYIDVFDSLHQLSQLEIDSFGTLRIGDEFAKLKNLNTLKIACEALRYIGDESFLGFNVSRVKSLSMVGKHNHRYDYEKCDNVFQNLPNISSITIANMKFGNLKFMHMLKPLQDRTLDLLHVDNVGLRKHQGNCSEDLQDVTVSANMVKYLNYMCIVNFTWLHSYAILIDIDALVSQRWRHCLKSLTLVTGGTIPIVEYMVLFEIMRLRNIRSLIWMTYLKEQAVDFWEDSIGPDGFSHSVGGYHKQFNKDHNVETEMTFASQNNNKNAVFKSFSQANDTNSIGSSERGAATYVAIVNDDVGNRNKSGSLTKKDMRTMPTIFLPPFLDNLVIDDMHSAGTKMNVSRNNSVRSITCRNTASFRIEWPSIGLDHLEVVDVSGSRLVGDPTVLKSHPSLKKVIMRTTYRDVGFYIKVLQSVGKLEYFDIAENNLQWLPKDAFRSNPSLKYLCLSSNRFSRIPFDLGLTPNLEILDLRENSLILTQQERQALDQHSLKHGNNFTILLSHNQISCACSSIFLIKWLQHSKIKFDENGDYTCMTEDGGLSKMSKYSDIEAFWRQCYGKSYVLTSLLIASTLGAFYLGSFLVIMHKTQILSKMKQIVQPMFRLKIREEFDFDVTIGYADQNVDFIRETLLPYLEGELGLRTFVHQRDLLQDPLMMFQAIRDSWRSLLIITEDFLDHYDLAHNVMKVCVFFVNVDNPKSLIVLVEATCRTRVPDYVLQVVDEDNIIILPQLSTPGLDYEARETLKTRIVL